MEISQKKGILLMTVCAVLWSIGGLFIKVIPWNPLVIAGWRSLIAAGVFACYLRWKKYRLVVNRQTLVCALALSCTLLFFVAANKLTTSANAIILQSTSPVFIMLLGTLFLGDHYRKIEYLLVAVVLGGIGLFFVDQLTPGSLWGNLIAVASGVTMALMFLCSSRLPDDESSQSALLLGHLITAAVGVPVMFFTETQVTPQAAGAILVLGIFQLGIPYLLYGIAVRICRPLTCSLIGMLEPLLNPVWVFLVIGEAPGMFAFIGGIIVLGTVGTWMVMNAMTAARQQEIASKNSEVTQSMGDLHQNM